ncbi:hypothetical protein [Jiella sp. M17.18]|uniref:hypothetical protein n=1 Tax=Jiella sp. M17.18 TaxID=3234247 RepID=UPI0034DFDBF1
MRHSQLILKNLRLSVMDNSTAFAFSTTITGSFALLNGRAPASVPEIFAGAAGGVVAFMVAEWLALIFLRDQPDNDSASTRLLGRMLNLISVGCALGTTYLVGRFLAGPLAWFLAAFASSLIFIVLEGLELAAAEAREENRRAAG